jgi:hypothetical protein
MFKNIKALLNLASELNTSLAKAQAFESVKTVEGDEINISGREVGHDVTTGSDSLPIADGTHTLEDGFKFTTKDGKIDSIVEYIQKIEDEVVAEELAEDATVEVQLDPAPTEDKSQEVEDLKAKIAELEAKLAELTSQFSTMESFATKEDFNSLHDVFTALNENVKVLAKIPVEQSKTSQSFKSESQKSKDYAALASALSGKK